MALNPVPAALLRCGSWSALPTAAQVGVPSSKQHPNARFTANTTNLLLEKRKPITISPLDGTCAAPLSWQTISAYRNLGICQWQNESCHLGVRSRSAGQIHVLLGLYADVRFRILIPSMYHLSAKRKFKAQQQKLLESSINDTSDRI